MPPFAFLTCLDGRRLEPTFLNSDADSSVGLGTSDIVARGATSRTADYPHSADVLDGQIRRAAVLTDARIRAPLTGGDETTPWRGGKGKGSGAVYGRIYRSHTDKWVTLSLSRSEMYKRGSENW